MKILNTIDAEHWRPYTLLLYHYTWWQGDAWEARAPGKGQRRRMNQSWEACFSNFILAKNLLERILGPILKYSDFRSGAGFQVFISMFISKFSYATDMFRDHSLSNTSLEKVCPFYIPVLNKSNLAFIVHNVWSSP